MFKDGPAIPVLVTVAVPAAKVEEVEYCTLYVVAPAAADQVNVGVLLTLVAALAGDDKPGALMIVVKLLGADQSDVPTTFVALTLQ